MSERSDPPETHRASPGCRRSTHEGHPDSPSLKTGDNMRSRVFKAIAAAVLLAVAWPAMAAYVSGNLVKVATASTTGTTAAFNATGANFLAVCVSSYPTTSGAPTITDSSGNTWVESSASPLTISTNNAQTYVFYAVNATVSSTQTVTATFATAASFSLVAGAWSGRATSSPIDAQASATETTKITTHTTAATGTLATSSDDLVGCIADNGNGPGGGGAPETWTASGSWTLPAVMTQADARYTPTAGIEYQDGVGTTSVSETWTTNYATIGGGIVLAVKPSGGGASCTHAGYVPADGSITVPVANTTLVLLINGTVGTTPCDGTGTPYYQPIGGAYGTQ
jgi:hypothetical protein